VFGGTFDPPHAGHIAVVEFVLAERLVDRVLVIPAGQPWLRPGAPLAPAADRLAMVRIAFDGRASVEVSDTEVERDGPTYTVDTLEELTRGGEPSAHYLLILGMDSARGIPRWHRYEQLVDMCELLIVGRPGERGPLDLAPGHPARQAKYSEGPLVEVSATDVRRRLANGQDVSGMVPQGVAAYIREHGLYGSGKCVQEGTDTR
jgi:nicotinate-nucleotide adenylyltransferase